MHLCGTFICLAVTLLMVTSIHASLNDGHSGGNKGHIVDPSDLSNGNAMHRRRIGKLARKRDVKNALSNGDGSGINVFKDFSTDAFGLFKRKSKVEVVPGFSDIVIIDAEDIANHLRVADPA